MRIRETEIDAWDREHQEKKRISSNMDSVEEEQNVLFLSFKKRIV